MEIKGVPSRGIAPVSPVYSISQELPKKGETYQRPYLQLSSTKSNEQRTSEDGLGQNVDLLV